LGAPAAITAVAHKLARLVYQTLKTGKLPAPETAAAYTARQREQAVATLRKKALRLGLRLIATGEIVEVETALS
jgi:hypothetical protein